MQHELRYRRADEIDIRPNPDTLKKLRVLEQRPHFRALYDAASENFPDAPESKILVICERWLACIDLIGISPASAVKAIERGYSSPYGHRATCRLLNRRGIPLNAIMGK